MKHNLKQFNRNNWFKEKNLFSSFKKTNIIVKKNQLFKKKSILNAEQYIRRQKLKRIFKNSFKIIEHK